MRTLWQALTNPGRRAPRWLRLPKRLLSIRASILLVYLVVVGGGYYAIMKTLIEEIQPRYLESMEESLVDTANVLAALVEREAELRGYDAAAISGVFTKAYERRFEARIYSLQKDSVDLQLYMTDERGICLFDSAQPENAGQDYSKWRDVRLTLRGEYGARATWVAGEGEAKALVLYVAAPVRVDGRIMGVVTVGKPTTFVNELIFAAEQRFQTYAVVAAVAILGLGAVLSVWLTRPIKRLIAYAQAVRDGKAAAYPRLFGFEANDLGRAFEEMREALEGKQYVERYVQSLTHQLKSPLSGISGAAELLEGEMSPEDRRRFLGNVRREAERMRRIVDRMLELAAVEARRGLQNAETLDLCALVAELVADLKPQLESEGLRWVVSAAGPVLVRGERFLLRQALGNVLQNACDFSPVGGRIEIAVWVEAGMAVVTASDEGPGVPEYALGRVTERFYSLARPRTGQKSSGIGLSFVKEIVSLHGGELGLANRAEGGALARLAFPLAAGR